MRRRTNLVKGVTYLLRLKLNFPRDHLQKLTQDRISDIMTWTELHDACEHQDSLRILKAMSAHDAGKVDEHGWTPLHILSWGCPNIEAMKTLLGVSPQAAYKQDAHGDTPLHVACVCPNTDVRVVESLLKACPEAASISNREGLMPLHMACRHASSNLEVIRALVNAFPQALREHIKVGNIASEKKRTSVLRVCKSNDHVPLDPSGGMATKASMDMHFEATSFQIRDGAYPLHMAIAASAPKEVIQLLFEGSSDVLLKTNKFGETPLHLALKYMVEDEIVLEMIKMAPQSLNIPEKTHGNAPVHMAASAGCSVEVAKALLAVWPDGIHMANADGLRPMEIAISSGACSDEVISMFAIDE